MNVQEERMNHWWSEQGWLIQDSIEEYAELKGVGQALLP